MNAGIGQYSVRVRQAFGRVVVSGDDEAFHLGFSQLGQKPVGKTDGLCRRLRFVVEVARDQDRIEFRRGCGFAFDA